MELEAVTLLEGLADSDDVGDPDGPTDREQVPVNDAEALPLGVALSEAELLPLTVADRDAVDEAVGEGLGVGGR